MAREKTMCLEGMFEPQKRNEAFTAGREVEPRDEGAVAVEPEPDAVADVEVAEVEIFPIVRHLPGVDEDRAVERPPRFPPVLGRHQQAVGILEAELAEAAKRLRAAQRRLEIERNLLARARIGENRGGVERDGPIAIGNRHVLLKVDGEAVEVE